MYHAPSMPNLDVFTMLAMTAASSFAMAGP